MQDLYDVVEKVIQRTPWTHEGEKQEALDLLASARSEDTPQPADVEPTPIDEVTGEPIPAEQPTPEGTPVNTPPAEGQPGA